MTDGFCEVTDDTGDKYISHKFLGRKMKIFGFACPVGTEQLIMNNMKRIILALFDHFMKSRIPSWLCKIEN